MPSYEMTPRRFANLSRARASEHLTRYADYLARHEFLAPILSTDNTPANKLSACQNELFKHWMINRSLDLKQSRDRSKGNKKTAYRYIVKVFDAYGVQLETDHLKISDDGTIEKIIQPMEYGVNDYASGERLADRRLFAREDSWYAEVSNTNGQIITTRIDRGDAVARILAKPRHAVMKVGKKTASLHWKPKSHASRSSTRWFIDR